MGTLPGNRLEDDLSGNGRLQAPPKVLPQQVVQQLVVRRVEGLQLGLQRVAHRLVRAAHILGARICEPVRRQLPEAGGIVKASCNAGRQAGRQVGRQSG
jgi:hypothetical protein